MYMYSYVSVYICKELQLRGGRFLVRQLFWYPSYVRVLYARKQDLAQLWVDEEGLYQTLYQQLVSKQYIKKNSAVLILSKFVCFSQQTHTLLYKQL